ncbi:MAG: S8 family peptidase [Clostridia bacterium]|nr:S8 family peptidase [Clostridia bacterium]
MKIDKIDRQILEQISILNFDRKIFCFVIAKDFVATRQHLRQKNIHIQEEYPFINAFFCKASKKEILVLSNVRQVEFISTLAKVSSLMFLSRKILQTEGIGLYGKNVGVAFIDTGISCHCDFMLGKNRICEFKDFIGDKNIPYDDNGHGTFVAGVCSGSGCLSNFKFSGIAPQSNIFALKALDGKGEATANKIIDAMSFVFDNHKKLGIKVVCMSFGSEPLGHNDPIMLGAEALWKDGVVVVAAAGNSGPEHQTIKSPGISPRIITVGGIDDNRDNEKSFNRNSFEIADFSSRGPAFRSIKPDLVAPSVDIVSCGVSKNYTTLSGTSVATPMIAGLCCLLCEKYPEIKPEQVKRLLLESCQSLGFERNFEGYGLPNIEKIFK